MGISPLEGCCESFDEGLCEDQVGRIELFAKWENPVSVDSMHDRLWRHVREVYEDLGAVELFSATLVEVVHMALLVEKSYVNVVVGIDLLNGKIESN